MPESTSERRLSALASRWLGVGLAAVISVITLVLAITGRLTLYISPETVWFAAAAAAVTLAIAIWTCTLPLGAEGDHDHTASAQGSDAAAHRRRMLQTTAVITGGVIASGVVIAGLLLPPASLSAQLAVSRAGEAPTLFAGADDISLGVADTASFGVGDWAIAFANSTRPERYDGAPVTLVGFVTPSEDGSLNLTRMVISHCVIDAQPASVAVSGVSEKYGTGQWVEVTGTVRASAEGVLSVEPAEVKKIAEPKDPYEY